MDDMTIAETSVLSYLASLSENFGYCNATNKHICDTLNLSDRTLYRLLKKLENRGLIKRETKSIGSDGKYRRIYVEPTIKAKVNEHIY